MASLGHETAAALAGVVGLCRTTQEDVEALQRHDEAALALLDINDDDAMKALAPWVRCLEAWAGPQGSQQPDGPWPTMTQLSTAILPSSNPDLQTGRARRTPPTPSETPLAAHKALTVILFRVMLMGSEVQGSAHRAPAAAAWAACRAYLIMLSLPGAAAYGILQPAVLGLVLTNLRAWCRSSAVYRRGGAAASATAAAVAVEGVTEAVGGAGAGGKKKGQQKRRRGGEAGGGSDSESDGGGEGGGGGAAGGGRGKRRTVAARGGAGGERGGSCGDVEACLRLLKACLAGVPLASHQDLTVKLSEVLVAIAIVATVEGSPALTDLASSTMVELVTGPSGYNETTHGAALQALMPVLLMSAGKADVPPRNKDCLKAHDIAFEIAKMIAIALRNASKKRLENRGSIPSNAGSVNNSEAEQNAGSIPAPSTSSVSAGGGGTSQSPTGDGSSASPASEGGSAGPDNGAKAPVVATDQAQDKPRPVLTMVQHLCVSAPERAEGRAKVAGGLKGLLPELEESDRARFVKFLVKLSRSARITHRCVAVELSARLLTETWPWLSSGGDVGGVEGGQPPASSSSGPGAVEASSPGFGDGGGMAMLGLVVARAGDRAPTVRSKAASTLADVLSGVQGGQAGYTGLALRKAVIDLCGWGGAAGDRGGGGGGQAGPLLEVVRSRVQDEKASVRKNAVPALEALLGFSPAFSGVAVEGVRGGATSAHAAELSLLQERCNDVSLSTRKAAMTALSSLLMTRPGDDYLQAAWVAAVLPLASDPEQTCQNRLVEIVRTVLLDRVVDWHRAEIGLGKAKGGRPARGEAGSSSSEGADRVSSVWSLLAKAGQGDAHKCLKKAIATLMLQKDPAYKARPLLNALRSAAVVALPPKAPGGQGEEQEELEMDEAGGWDAEDLRLLSLAQDLPRAFLTTIRRGTWALLEAFLDRAPSPGGGAAKKDCPDMDPMFVVRCWNRVRGHILREALPEESGGGGGDGELSSPESEEAFESDGRRVLGVLARLAWSVPAEVATPLAESLLEMLLDLVARPETSAALVGALHMLCFAKADSEESGAAMCNAWANHALSAFEGLLDVFVYQGSGALQDHTGARACGFDMARLVERLLFAVGEVVVVGFTGKEEAAGPSEPEAAGGSGGAAVLVRPIASPRLIKLVQVLLPPRLPSSAHGVEEGEEGPPTPSAVRALAFVTLGKLCLRDKELAKSSVNILVRELDTAVDPAVRSNALVVLGDLCVRYTAMVDRHVGAMAACLQDSHPLVRRHAILLISQLLLQDYVKWRGLLLFRFLATLVDSDASVRCLGAFTLTNPLIAKTPGLFAQNFVETMFVLNDYSEHPCYAAAAAGRADAGGGITMEGIHLGGAGPEQRRKRMSVYSTMLNHMSDEHKITVTAKLAQEVLSAAIDGGLPLAASSSASSSTPRRNSAAFSTSNRRSSMRADRSAAGLDARQKASAVVKDALLVMASSGIRVGARGGSAAGDLDDGADDMGSQQSGNVELAAAKSKLLTKVALKHLMETVVPVLTALKHVLEKAHSPLLRELMFYFGELFRNHKEDVKAVLQSEAGLVEEIDYDLRRFQKEEQERREKAKEAAAAAASMAAAAAAAAAAAPFPTMGPPRTPKARRSMGDGGGGVTSGKRDSFPASGMRAPRTPMAAALKSARKTPFQNLGECSAVKLKGSAAMFCSPTLARSDGGGGGGRGRGMISRPKTPLQLRTPREAVAAALGVSAMAISPLPMRSMSGSAGRDGVSTAGEGGSSGGADIELPSPDHSHPAKRRRWSVSVAPPPDVNTPPDVNMHADGNPAATDEESEAEFDGNGDAYFRGVDVSPSVSDGGKEGTGAGDEERERDGQKENDPASGNASGGGGNPGKGRANRSKANGEAGGGRVKGDRAIVGVTKTASGGGKSRGKGKVSAGAAEESAGNGSGNGAGKGLRNGSKNGVKREARSGAKNGAEDGAENGAGSGAKKSGARTGSQKKEADLPEATHSKKTSGRRSTRTTVK